MSDPSLALIDVALDAAEVAAEDPLALLQEGSVKVAIMRALLQAGCTLREGSPRTGDDWLISGSPDAPTARLVGRTGTGGTKSDIRIEEPCRLVFEFKVFGEVGSKDSFNRGEILRPDRKGKNENSFLWDLKAVLEKRADVAFFVCGARQYDTARGERWDPRGRTAGVVLADLLPPRSELRCKIAEFRRSWRGSEWYARALLAKPPRLTEYAKDSKIRRKAEQRVVMALRLAATAPTQPA